MTTILPLKTDDILQAEYNAVPYQSFPFSHTHPTHLFTLATLFGLHPTPVENAKVLELGCASGGNLIPMAYRFPHTTFLGIDLAENQVNEGIKQIADLNLKNVQLHHQSILNFSEKEGKFDYIICHGVYSWVDDNVKEKILQICRKNLTPNGIAYVSYNTLPGWNMVNSIRELMAWHTKSIQDPPTKASQARSVLKFISDGLNEDKSPYAEMLRNEVNLLSKQSDNYLLHDHLSSFNQPIYFYQFIEQANAQNLSYLSDAFLPTMFTGNLPASLANELNKMNNIITIGQYMDFVRNQRFRCTLLCHEQNQVNRSLKTKDIENFYLQMAGKPKDPLFSAQHIQEGKEICFVHNNITLTVRNAVSQLAMLILCEEQDKPIHYNTLCEKIAARGSKDIATIKTLLNDDLNLMRMAFAGLINIKSYCENYVLQVPEKPYVCSLIRYQGQKQNYVTNQRHEPVAVAPLVKALLPHLDGTHTIDELINFTKQYVSEGLLLVLDENKQQVRDKKELNKRIVLFFRQALENMAKQGLLSEPE